MSYDDIEIASALGGLDSDAIGSQRTLDAGLLRKQVMQSNLLKRTPVASGLAHFIAPQFSDANVNLGFTRFGLSSSEPEQVMAVGTGPWWPGERTFTARVQLTFTRAGQTTLVGVNGYRAVIPPRSLLSPVIRGPVPNPSAPDQDWIVTARVQSTSSEAESGVTGGGLTNPFFQGGFNPGWTGSLSVGIGSNAISPVPDGGVGGQMNNAFTTAIDEDFNRPYELLCEPFTFSTWLGSGRTWRRRISRGVGGRTLNLETPLTEEERDIARQPSRFTIVLGGRVDLGGVTIMCGEVV